MLIFKKIKEKLTYHPFMSYSTCNASDFFNPNYKRICQNIMQKPQLHRKQWEFAYIIWHLYKNKCLFPNAKGLGFGVGNEPLSSFFASLNCHIVATDAPQDIAYKNGWHIHQQFADNLEKIYKPEILSKSKFNQFVTYQTCDMNNIDPYLMDFDFCWSSCCFEHLGSLEAGIEFVVNSVEKTLKNGGIACHTTEYNLSSNEDTLSEGVTVIYRKKDIQNLIQRLELKGHLVTKFRLAPNKIPLDYHIDTPPYKQDIHIKLKLAEYNCTSLGLVIQKKI